MATAIDSLVQIDRATVIGSLKEHLLVLLIERLGGSVEFTDREIQ